MMTQSLWTNIGELKRVITFHDLMLISFVGNGGAGGFLRIGVPDPHTIKTGYSLQTCGGAGGRSSLNGKPGRGK